MVLAARRLPPELACTAVVRVAGGPVTDEEADQVGMLVGLGVDLGDIHPARSRTPGDASELFAPVSSLAAQAEVSADYPRNESVVGSDGRRETSRSQGTFRTHNRGR